MTLQDHYAQLPEPSHPKKEFVVNLAKECNVPIRTAFSWVRGERRPLVEHWPIIEQMTGIPQDELFHQQNTDNNE